ncbi:MAG: NDP-sugar synthase [Actinobacteria bacterium]|nr:NDP-sugar synthase [Actinomycetota bacterium]
MHAVVLVGGFGTRLRPLTLATPKPLLPIANLPLLERLMASLARGGVSDAVLSLGFKPEPFLDAFPSNVCAGVRLTYAVEDRPLDTAGAIGFAARQAEIHKHDESFVVANGDVLCDLDISALVKFHKSNGAQATIHLTPVEDPSQYGVVETNPQGKVLRFVEKPSPGETNSRNVNGGTYVFEVSALERMPGVAPLSIERNTFPEMVRDGQLFGYATSDYWIDAGRPESYVRANIDLLQRESIHQVEAVSNSAQIAKSAMVTQSVVGRNCTVGENAQIIRSVLLEGSSVDQDAVVVDSAVMGRIGSFAQVTSCLVGVDGEVRSGAVLRDAKVPDAS